MKASIKLAIAGALSLAGLNAMALSPADIQAGPMVNLYVSGATATDNAFENMAKINAAGYCYPGTLDIYYFKSSSGSIQQRALTCRANFTQGAFITAATSTTTGTKIAIFKESAGGSANGIINPATGVGLNQIDFYSGSANFATACSTITSTVAANLDFAQFNTRDCGFVASPAAASTVNRVAIAPDAGISDVDPGTFVGLGGVTDAHVAALSRKRSSVAVTFNPIVSTPLFLALQRAQGLDNAGAEDTTSIAKMPTLSSSIARGVFTGAILDASQIYSNGVRLSTLAGTDTAIYICRRGDTSGTMTSFKVHFLGQGCSKNSASIAKFVSPDDTACEAGGCAWNATTYGAAFTFAGAGSGDVRSCMDYQSSQGRFAIGVASTEAKPGTTSNRYRYVKVDGAAPTLRSVMDGSYEFFTENSFNDKYTTTISSGAQALWDFTYNNIGNKTSIAKVNESWRDAAAIGTVGTGDGDTGILDLPVVGSANVPTFPVLAAQVRTNPVNGQRRASPTATTPNNCNRSIMVTP